MTLASGIADLAGAVRDKINAMMPRLLPAGGGTGQVLAKSAAGDFAVSWHDASAGASALGGVAVLSLTGATFSHVETVAAVGVTPASRIIAGIGAHADTDENSPELLDVLTISGAAGTDEITFTLTFAVPTRGPININWSAF